MATTQVFLPGKLHGQRSLVGYSPWDHKELDTTVCTHAHVHTHTHSTWHFSLSSSVERKKEKGKGGSSVLCVCVSSVTQSYNRLFVTPWTVARQAPLSLEFSRQEYWSGLPFPSLEVLYKCKHIYSGKRKSEVP